MSNQPRRSPKLLWTVLASVAVALWPPHAQAAQSGTRLRPAGSQHLRMKRTGHSNSAKRSPSVRAAPAASR
jgi:hypothetical protein